MEKIYYRTVFKPSLFQLWRAKQFAKRNHCIVKLEWYIKYSGQYNQHIDAETPIFEVRNFWKRFDYPI